MIYPTITELTKDEFNRYELTLATAKCARIITNEYVQQREAAEKEAAENKEMGRNLMAKINKEYRDEKAVKNAIGRIYRGEYKIVHTEPLTEEELAALAEAEAAEETEAAAEAELLEATDEDTDTAEETDAEEAPEEAPAEE
ncbi:MAG: hypothetical protein IJ011_10525 [Clostridia bacterium]|nr:hypothetical protein [Clostridia bacterium]MBQ8850756.1 hypothetical protein [Clostridia bacterium]